MSELKRYLVGYPVDGTVRFDEADEGTWCRYDAAYAKIAALRAEVEKLQDELQAVIAPAEIGMGVPGLVARLRAEVKTERNRHRAWTDYFQTNQLTHAASRLESTEDNVRRLSAEVERLRMQLAACGCAAMANTDETSPRARDISDEYKSASWGDVCRAVDREMEQRAEIEALRAEVEFWKSAAEEHHRKIRDEVERLRNRDHEAQLPGGHDKTLCGPLCPYCEVERLREELKAKEDKP